MKSENVRQQQWTCEFCKLTLRQRKGETNEEFKKRTLNHSGEFSKCRIRIVLNEKFMKIIKEEVKFPWDKSNPQDLKAMQRALLRAFKEGAIAFEVPDIGGGKTWMKMLDL